MAWCVDNLRDLDGWQASGLALSTPSNESARLLDGVIRQIVSWRDCDQLGGIVKSLGDLKKSDTNAALANALLLNMDAFGTGKSEHTNASFREEIKAAEELSKSSSINERERKHLQASVLWARGNFPSAQSTWEEILKDHPNDLIAVKFAHDSYFFSGDAQGKRDSIARVIHKWKKDEPCRSYLHGMYAFGLEECGEYDKAEEHAKTALRERREDCWATHAFAHVMEMQGRTKESQTFLESTVKDWEPGWLLACHNYWHAALAYIEDGMYEVPLTLFDSQIGRRTRASRAPLDIVDAASILWRLELEGVDVGKRWSDLPDLSPHIDDHFLSFNDAHFAMAFKRSGQEENANKLRGSLDRFVRSNLDAHNHRIAEMVGQPLAEGMIAYAEGDYQKTVDLIFPIRQSIHLIGGSHAQNDVFTQTLIHACLRTGKQEHKDYARTVLLERAAKKSHSGIAERLSERIDHSNL